MRKFSSFTPGEVEIPKFHGMLLGAVAPRPICFASTISENGEVNLSPYSFFNIFGANPPIMIFSPARRVRDNTIKHTLENVMKVKECVINIVDYNMVQQMSLSSTEYEQGVNEFLKAGLTMLESELVKAPRVAESPAQFECIVKEIIETGSEGGAGNLVICEVVKAHFADDIFDADGKVDPDKADLVARMGGNWYSRAKLGKFEVEKPLKTKGVGVDALPEPIRNSHVFSGNDLGKLANVEKLPSQTEVEDYLIENPGLREIIAVYKSNPESLTEAVHSFSKKLLASGRKYDALLAAYNILS